MRYEDYVKRAKFLIETIQCHQAEIAYIATKVCEIKHGGKTSIKTYTLTRFSKDIGINVKTISGWVSIYKNVILKIDKSYETVTKKDWQTASQVDDMIRQEARARNALEGLSKKKTRPFDSYSPEIIKDIYGKVYTGDNFQKDVLGYIRYVIFIKNRMQAKDLSQCSASSLLTLKENLDMLSDTITRHLTLGRNTVYEKPAKENHFDELKI
jgi:hypothetical protein